MEDVEILRNLGTPPDVLERYVEWRNREHKTYLAIYLEIFFILIVMYLLFITDVIIGCNGKWWFSIFFMGVIITLLTIIYTAVITILSTKEELKLMKKSWIPFGLSINKEPTTLVEMLIFYYGIMLYVFIILVLSKAIVIALIFLLCFIIVPTPLFRWSIKKDKELGYTISRLFPGDVDEIAEKIEKALGGKKKILVKSERYRRYQINFPNMHNFRIYVSRRPDEKDFVKVSIAGVKLENVAPAKEISSEIESLTGK